MYTTIQNVREFAGIQNYRIDTELFETGSSAVWIVNSGDLAPFVPTQANGATITSSGDVTVKYNGLSIGFSSIDASTGEVNFGATGYASGSSITATYASSPITNGNVFSRIEEAHSVINSYLSKRYELPFGACVPMLTVMETNYASARILISSYGVSGQDSAEDGYRLMQEVLDQLNAIANGDLNLVDVDGNVIDDSNTAGGGGNASGGQGVRVKGYLFPVSDEEFKVTNPNEINN